MKPQLLASEIEWNKYPRLVWRYEYADSNWGPYNGQTGLTVAMGVATIYTHTFTLGEISHLKYMWKAVDASDGTLLTVGVYLDGFVCDYGYTFAGAYKNGTAVATGVIKDVAVGEHTVLFTAQANNGTLAMYFYNAHIEIAKA